MLPSRRAAIEATAKDDSVCAPWGGRRRLGGNQTQEDTAGEYCRHIEIVVLAGLEENLSMRALQLVAERTRFDELRPGTDDGWALPTHAPLYCCSGLIPLRIEKPTDSGCQRPQQPIRHETPHSTRKSQVPSLEEIREHLDILELRE
jgi:hypothetical protein